MLGRVNTRCPHCGWPVDDPAYPADAHGPVAYRRCACGAWLVLERGALVASPRVRTTSPDRVG
ncbi:hypothetical protein KCV87_02905 [Actinosynnema pretiosum subsp. pretiosum]|uniref:Uncharacterized protein n=2 Tax=Actinosynnema TaxID=40566 RepID=C6W9W3_ACTMD|nr:hypothetical protein Amir_3433 [Actinosynnema mirum DSM 43827]QUF05086.1 hypothetical protein KCV87_02905 [Actinosynnema pretiosum subsp. pretiosum]